MISAFHISLADPEQAQEISRLITSLASYFVSDLANESAKPFLATFSAPSVASFISNPAFRYYTASAHGALLGVIALRDNMHIYHLFVAPESHGQGVARALWERAKTDAIHCSQTSKFSVNSSVYAVPVYARLGFRAAGTEIERNGVRYVPMVHDSDAQPAG